MSKSIGNFVTINDALERFRPEMIRMFMESIHYSNPMVYEESSMEAAARGWERMYNAVRLLRRAMNTAPDGSGDSSAILTRVNETRAAFNAAMDDDFSSPQALAALQEFTRDVNTLLNSGQTVGLGVLSEIDNLYKIARRRCARHHPGDRRSRRWRCFARSRADRNADRVAGAGARRTRTGRKATASATNWRKLAWCSKIGADGTIWKTT